VTEPRIQIQCEERPQRVKRITLDRPPVNAASGSLLDDLAAVLRAAHDEDIDALVLTGAGELFCAGNDIYEFVSMNSVTAEDLMRSVRGAFWALYDCPFPVIARVNGAALGTGLALTALCDVVVASDRAEFALPELDVGVLGGMKFGRRFLPELAVRRMFFTAERIPAAEFKAMGAPITVVPHEQLDEAVDDLLAVLLEKGGVALRFAKQAMNAVEHLDMKPGYEFEQTFTVRMADRPEAKQAVQAVIDDIAARRSAGSQAGCT
jgi:enoyl-CoA hydratase